MKEQPIMMTYSDHRKLAGVVEARRFDSNRFDIRAIERLAGELARAQLVESQDIPPEVVTMDSNISVRDLDSNEMLIFTLSWPDQSDAFNGRINVLAPLGMALLGCRIGQNIQWPVPCGMRRLRVEDIVFQPEKQFHA